jgi:hypothetical protein
MPTKTLIFALSVVTLGFSFQGSARAGIAIDPQCAAVPDKVGCTCALRTGGRVYARQGMMRWSYPRLHVDTFEKCRKAG